MNRDMALGYLAGIIDGEGTITNSKKGNRRVVIYNTDQSIIDVTCEVLDMLEIEFKVYKRQKMQMIHISRLQNLRKLEEVPIRCTKKIVKLRKAIEGYKKMPDSEQIRELIFLGKTDAEIASIMGIGSRTAVIYWRRKFGISKEDQFSQEFLDEIVKEPKI